MAVTQLTVVNNVVLDQKLDADQNPLCFTIGYGQKKLKNVNKPLRTQLEKSGFSIGVRKIKQVNAEKNSPLKLKTGDTVKVQDVLAIGDVVKVQGVTKGRGFAGAIKRHGFSGGPKTHGQSDRWRAVGAIGQRTTPGRVFRGKRMPGHYGTEIQTVLGLTVLHLDAQTQTIWLSGPIPGHMKCTVQITKTGQKKNIDLDQKASGIPAAPVVPEEKTEVQAESTEVTTTTEDKGAQ